MLKSTYLLRLDDACPTMNLSQWQRMEYILDCYDVKPMVGVIPNNEDSKQQISLSDDGFWERVRTWEKKGWAIALHGYNHCYNSNGGLQGLNPMWKRSEFAGLPFEKQRNKIKKGVSIMRENGINPKYFFAPSHTFDMNTLEALRCESDIRIISDTIGRYPYKMDDFWFIPQILGHCMKMPFNGIYTFCFHPSVMNEKAFCTLESFLERNGKEFISFDEIDLESYGNKRLIDKFLSRVFFVFRRLRGLR